MTSRRRFIAALGASSLTAALLFGPGAIGSARAQTPEALLASGAAGERWDGYMEARQSSAAGAVAAINAKRKAVYEKRAKEQGVSAEAVGQVYAKEIIDRAPAGSWIKQQNGQWVQK